MTFVVESGTGLSNAVSYASVEASDSYHKSKGNRYWEDVPNSDRGAWVISGSYSAGNLVTVGDSFYKANDNFPASIDREHINTPWDLNTSTTSPQMFEKNEIRLNPRDSLHYLCVEAYAVPAVVSPATEAGGDKEPGTDGGKRYWAEYEPVANAKNPLWKPLTNSDCFVTKEQCLIRATDYIDQRFGTKFRGYKLTSWQSLEFPRGDAYDNADRSISGVPRKLKNATFEYAIRAAEAFGLMPDPLLNTPNQNFSLPKGRYKSHRQDTSDINTGNYRQIRNVIGPLEEELYFSYRETDRGARTLQTGMVSDINIPQYPEADLWLEEFLRNSHSTTMLERG